MIVLDFETTGLAEVDSLKEHKPDKQPRIIEVTMAKLDNKTLKEIDRKSFMVNPSEPLSDEVQRITHIRQDEVNKAQPFEFHFKTFCDMFLGEDRMVAHNCAFEAKIMEFEMLRIGKALFFPWPVKRICTVEASMHLRKRRLKLDELYELATGRKRKGAHRTDVDVTDLIVCLRWLVKGKAIQL
jgi:DNA polymerase III alpha subunit (gram-positive type)